MEKKISLPVVRSFDQLISIAAKANVQLTVECRQDILFAAIKRLGPERTEKNIAKLISGGQAQWSTEQQEFEVEKIVDHVKENGEDLYFIKWLGWAEKYNTWEPVKNLLCPELITEFEASRQGGRKRKRNESLETGCKTKGEKVELLKDLVAAVMNAAESETIYSAIIRAHHNLTRKNKEAAENLCGGAGTSHDYSTVRSCKRSKVTQSAKVKRGKKVVKADVKAALMQWERKINEVNKDPAKIVVENKVDLEGPPAGFTYISDYIPGKGVEIPNDPIVGCECTSCCATSDCCPKAAGVDFPYYKNCRRTRLIPGQPIYECNSRCKCSKECPNRVVQLGRKHKVCIYRTKMKGWGVKTLQRIKQGSFVMEYIGEVITNEEAEKRGEKYDAEGHTFLFDLDYSDSENAFTVDAGKFGNVAHFVNHSCDPNMVVYGVWINHLDYRLPRIALFAKRDIEAEEELTFDYLIASSREQEDGLEPCMVACDQPETTEDEEDSGVSSAGTVSVAISDSESTALAKKEDSVGDVVKLSAALLPVGESIGNESYVELASLVRINNIDSEDKSEDSGLSCNSGREEEVNGTLEPLDLLLTSQSPTEERVDDKPLTSDDTASSSPQLDVTENMESDVVEAVEQSVSTAGLTSPQKDTSLAAATSPSQQVNMFRNRKTPRGFKYSMRCQCGAKNCRQFLC